MTICQISSAGDNRINSKVKSCNRITSRSTGKCYIVCSGSSITITVPGIRQLAITNSYISSAGDNRINSKVKSCNGITSRSTGKCYIVCSGSSITITVPGIRQLAITNSYISSAGDNRINSKVKSCNRITSRSTGKCYIICSGSSITIAVPGIRQLAITNSYISSAGDNRINSKVKSCNGITSRSTGKCYIICSGSSITITVPGIRQLAITNSYISSAGDNRINSKVKSCNGITSRSTGECYKIGRAH